MISVVIPVRNEKENVRQLHKELLGVFRNIKESFEIIFVNDGSTDGTLEVLQELEPARVVSFVRNMGKSEALLAGFAVAKGDRIFTMDGDLQDDPAEIPHFLEAMECGSDLVVGWKQNRLDGASKGIVSKIANVITGWATGVRVHDMNCGYKLYKADVAKMLVLTGDHHRYIPALIAIKGYKVSEQKITHRKRDFGESKYGNFGRFFNSFFDFVTVVLLVRFGNRPMHLFGIFGFIATSLGIGILVYISWLIIVENISVANRPLLFLGILLVVVGFQSFVSGFLGELVIRQRNEWQNYRVSERGIR